MIRKTLTYHLSSVCLAWVTITSCGVDANEAPPLRSAFPLDALRSVTPADAKLSAEILIEKLAEGEGYDYSATVTKNHQLLISGLKEQRHDIFLMFAYEYLQQKEQLGIKPILLGVRAGDDARTELILLINREKGIEGAKGGELSIQRGSGELPMLWLSEEFAEKQLPAPDQFFKKITHGDSANQTVLSVFFGKKEACIVSLDSYNVMVELNPQLEQRLEKFAVSAPLLSSIICLREDFKEIHEGMIQEIGTKLHNDPEGSQILSLMRVRKLNKFRPELLGSLNTLLEKREKRLKSLAPGEASASSK